MSDTQAVTIHPEASDLVYPFQPTWCKGCGNFGIWGALKLALNTAGIPKEQIVMVYDVGCSGNMADFNEYYGFHALHGRALPAATGIKLGNHNLKIIVVIGDGGCYGEGGTHFLNLMRGNHDITVLVHDNHRYSLTTGQMSPTTDKGTKTKSTPNGSIEEPMNPLAIAVSNNCGYVAREFAADLPTLANRIKDALNYPGFALVDVLQPCPVYNKEMSYDWYRQRIEPLSESHMVNDKAAAWTQAMRSDRLPVGLFYRQDKPAYHQQVPNLQEKVLKDHTVEHIDLSPLLGDFR